MQVGKGQKSLPGGKLCCSSCSCTIQKLQADTLQLRMLFNPSGSGTSHCLESEFGAPSCLSCPSLPSPSGSCGFCTGPACHWPCPPAQWSTKSPAGQMQQFHELDPSSGPCLTPLLWFLCVQVKPFLI